MADSDEEDLSDAELAAEIARLQQEMGDNFDELSDTESSPPPMPPPRQGYDAKVKYSSSSTQLERQLQQKDNEIAELRAMLSAGKGAVETLKEQKYLDALKKVRYLTVQLEKERTTTRKLTQQLVTVEKQLLEAQNFNILPSATGDGTGGSVMPGSEEDLQRQLRDARGRLEKANKVVEQLRRQGQDAAAEMKKMRQVLAREVGEESVDRAMEEGSGWRGRAQLIGLLRAKLKQVQRTAGQSAVDAMPAGDDNATERSAPTAVTATTRRDHNDVHQERLERMQAKRAKEVADLNLTVQAKDQEIKELREKTEALQARTATLEKHGADLKMKLHRVIAKTENDDKLVEMYRQELAALRGAKKGPGVRTPPRSAGDLGNDDTIQGLRSELFSTKQKLMDALCTQTTQRSLDSSGDSGTPTRLRFAEVELEKLRDLAQLLKDQLAAEAEQHTATTSQLRVERQKTAGLERALAKEGGMLPKMTTDDQVAMLRDETRSLKEQLLKVHQLHSQEVTAYQQLVDQLKASMSNTETYRQDSAHNNDQELQDLRRQYSELRGMYNALAMRQGR